MGEPEIVVLRGSQSLTHSRHPLKICSPARKDLLTRPMTP